MTGPQQVRVPPHSTQAEQGLLGGVLLDGSVIDRLAKVRPDDMYVWDHRVAWAAIQTLHAANRPVDVLTVSELLRQRREFIGDVADGDQSEAAVQATTDYLQALAMSVPNAGSAPEYARVVVDLGRRRRLIQEADKLAAQAWDTRTKATTDELIDQAVTGLLRLQDGMAAYEPRDIQPLTVDMADDLEKRAAGHTDAMGTGLRALDRLTGDGGRRGEVWVIGARPSNGKTALSLELCRAVAAHHQVLMLTQEDSAGMLTQRHVAAAGSVNLADIRNPKAAPDSMWTGVMDGIAALQPLRLSICDQPSLTMADVRRHVQAVRRRHRDCAMVVIDYLQLMSGSGDTRNQMLGELANGLKQLAKELQCWVVLLSQLNREADKRTGPPQMADLRDSGDIEGCADVIMLLSRPYLRNHKEADKHLVEAHIVKHKNGPTAQLKFFFDGARQRFADWSDEEAY